MGLHVLTQDRGSAVAFVAIGACEWLVDSMYGHVFSQLTVHVECATTNITFEQLVARVDLLVRIQSALT